MANKSTDALVTEERRIANEASRSEAERVRRIAEAARQHQELDREALDQVRQERESSRQAAEAARAAAEQARSAAEDARHAAETARQATEEARDAAEKARHAAVESVKATANAIAANLEQMKFIEDMRRIYRDLADSDKPKSNQASRDWDASGRPSERPGRQPMATRETALKAPPDEAPEQTGPSAPRPDRGPVDAPGKRHRKPPPQERIDTRMGEPQGKKMGQKSPKPGRRGGRGGRG